MNEYDRDYYENGPQKGVSLYQNYRWIPELTLPLAHRIVNRFRIDKESIVLDYGCAKGYLVHALRLLGYKAYGVDVSTYAIESAPKEVAQYIKHITPDHPFFAGRDPGADIAIYTPPRYLYDERWGSVKFTHVIAKDVLEHVDYNLIDELLEAFCRTIPNLMIIVPLGENGKYRIPAMELDKTHKIRENEVWWTRKVRDAGYESVYHTTDVGNLKMTWEQANGNLLILASRED